MKKLIVIVYQTILCWLDEFALNLCVANCYTSKQIDIGHLSGKRTILFLASINYENKYESMNIFVGNLEARTPSYESFSFDNRMRIKKCICKESNDIKE